MKARELDHVRFAARHFNGLQGLRYWVPLGLITLSVGGTTYFESPPFRVLRAALLVGAVLLAFAARRYYRDHFGEVEPQPVPFAEPAAFSIYSPAGGVSPVGSGFQEVRPAVRLFSLAMGLVFAVLLTVWSMSPSVILEEDESLVQAPWHASDVLIMVSTDGMGPWELGSKALLGQFLYALFGSFFLAVWLWRGCRVSQSYYLAFALLLLGFSALGVSLGWFPSRSSSLAPFVGHLWVSLLLCGGSMIVAGLLDHLQLARMLERPLAVEG